ncbi:carboxypeptidase-like regulatory domain-containing protein [Natronorubrum tibetense]|uniref:Coiled-coil protein n=1 Tax=Natronorubrum tibetense GA33 TaxID=1114856 RepID=L9W8Q6_9EURY|nr:carboxypeptidase-like regulatory domain-containing protein [Natronorubrum tibetense]ELY44708.1 coiled-coil protein [Natronorubrum tibetense GA33]
MNANAKTAFGIGALVALAAAASAGVFVWSGSQAATWFVIVGIPLITVAGIALYVRGVIARSGTSEQQFVRTRAQSTAEEFQTCIRRINELQNAYSDWNPAIDARLDSVAGDFRAEGVDFDLESGAYDLGKGVNNADLPAFEQLSTEVDNLETTVDASLREFGEEELSRIETTLERLDEATLVQFDRRLQRPVDDAPIPEFRDAIDSAREDAVETIETAIETVREMGRGETRPDDSEAVERDLESASEAVDRYEFESAADSILAAQDRLRDEFAGSFEMERDAVLALTAAVTEADVAEHVDADYLDDVSRIESTVDGMDSALDLTELSRPRSELRRTCVDMIATMERELAADVRTLRNADLPSGYYTEPAVVDEQFVDEINEIDDFGEFTERWATIAAELRDALDTASTKAAVIDAYDDVAETIETELEQHGEVTGDALPVRHADQFLGLYFRRNDSVEFDPDTPLLRRGTVETHELTIDITYDRGGETRTATIELTDSGYTETVTIETRIAGTATITDVPAGTYTLSADPGDEMFGRVEREIRLEEETTTSIEFTEQSLREQVCADVETDIEAILPEVRPRLETLFEDEGYVSTATDLPVRSSYAPCVLAVWADQTSYDVCRDGEAVVVYDRDQLERELTNVLRYNVESGDRLAFDELEQNFLSAPVPGPVIRDVIEGIDSEHRVTATETAIEVH